MNSQGQWMTVGLHDSVAIFDKVPSKWAKE